MQTAKLKQKPGQVITRRPNGKIAVGTPNKEESRTQQQYRDDCDANVIIEKIKKGHNVQFNQRKGTYGDFTNSPSYHEALDVVRLADEAFMAMPSALRTRFKNDPQNLLDFLNDKDKIEESYRLGLREKKPTPKPDEHLETLKGIHENTKPRKKYVED